MIFGGARQSFASDALMVPQPGETTGAGAVIHLAPRPLRELAVARVRPTALAGALGHEATGSVADGIGEPLCGCAATAATASVLGLRRDLWHRAFRARLACGRTCTDSAPCAHCSAAAQHEGVLSTMLARAQAPVPLQDAESTRSREDMSCAVSELLAPPGGAASRATVHSFVCPTRALPHDATFAAVAAGWAAKVTALAAMYHRSSAAAPAAHARRMAAWAGRGAAPALLLDAANGATVKQVHAAAAPYVASWYALSGPNSDGGLGLCRRGCIGAGACSVGVPVDAAIAAALRSTPLARAASMAFASAQVLHDVTVAERVTSAAAATQLLAATVAAAQRHQAESAGAVFVPTAPQVVALADGEAALLRALGARGVFAPAGIVSSAPNTAVQDATLYTLPSPVTVGDVAFAMHVFASAMWRSLTQYPRGVTYAMRVAGDVQHALSGVGREAAGGATQAALVALAAARAADVLKRAPVADAIAQHRALHTLLAGRTIPTPARYDAGGVIVGPGTPGYSSCGGVVGSDGYPLGPWATVAAPLRHATACDVYELRAAVCMSRPRRAVIAACVRGYPSQGPAPLPETRTATRACTHLNECDDDSSCSGRSSCDEASVASAWGTAADVAPCCARVSDGELPSDVCARVLPLPMTVRPLEDGVARAGDQAWGSADAPLASARAQGRVSESSEVKSTDAPHGEHCHDSTTDGTDGCSDVAADRSPPAAADASRGSADGDRDHPAELSDRDSDDDDDDALGAVAGLDDVLQSLAAAASAPAELDHTPEPAIPANPSSAATGTLAVTSDATSASPAAHASTGAVPGADGGPLVGQPIAAMYFELLGGVLPLPHAIPATAAVIAGNIATFAASFVATANNAPGAAWSAQSTQALLLGVGDTSLDAADAAVIPPANGAAWQPAPMPSNPTIAALLESFGQLAGGGGNDDAQAAGADAPGSALSAVAALADVLAAPPPPVSVSGTVDGIMQMLISELQGAIEHDHAHSNAPTPAIGTTNGLFVNAFHTFGYSAECPAAFSPEQFAAP